ncbi:hypothetical protein [Yoonia sediminilitoris]|uniref:Uncharacterized protein n=1 Tax=Yoonia sediminilitoris TaxID=1286148 RepID=A0A2T6K8I2_9RHOB|nr:hypothetical protein [Yoonia sediminilitoris]PUB11054.1 hypothetical protein C8N45_11538 [Yoonia sediminilitoris]RCW90973.1 hypothetical protein DFP92_11538 [Yoonia sediminilitoris]
MGTASFAAISRQSDTPKTVETDTVGGLDIRIVDPVYDLTLGGQIRAVQRLNRVESRDVPGFEAYVGIYEFLPPLFLDDGRIVLFEAEGDATAARILHHADTPPDHLDAYDAQRFSDGGTMPLTGTATYNGDYAGFLRRTTNDRLTESYIAGTVKIDVDFADGTAAGDITNRTRFLTANGSRAGELDDVRLGALNFANGASVAGGITEGGKLAQSSAVPEGGDRLQGGWDILFGGDGAPEAVGIVDIDHDYVQDVGGIGDDFNEIGVFAVGR